MPELGLTRGGVFASLPGLSHWKVRNNEEDISAKRTQAPQEARVSRAHEHDQRPQGTCAPPQEGSLAPDSFIRAALVNERPTPAVTDTRFSADRRLLQKRDFERVLREGRKQVRPSLVVYCHPRPDTGPTRLGLTVSRRVGKAHTRNLIKRRLREAFRLAQPRLHGGFDIIAIARHNAGATDYHELRKQLKSALGRLGVVQERNE